MATSIALALAAAAITACGGGGADSQGTSDTASTVGSTATTTTTTTTSASSSDSAASAVEPVTTNESAVAATSGDTSASSGTDTVASTDDTSTVIASADTSTAGTAANESAAASDVSAQAVISTSPSATSSATVTRPVGNTGTGFFVANGKLYDAKGKEFRIRGVNRTHYDSYGSPAGIPLSGANTERIALDYVAKTTSFNMSIVSKQMLANKIVPMPGNWSATCKSDAASLSAIVDIWVAQAATWTTLNSNGLINIANEWGPANSTVWRDNYITAIQRMRAAGYTGTLIVDAGGCGQDTKDVINYGAAVLAADPQKNILFDVHVYGNFYYPATATWQQDYTKSMAALKATGLPIIIGEFGPGRKVGPSPTLITPEQVIATAESNGWGWMPWSWDDNNLAACAANDAWFSMTTKCGTYTGVTTDLTLFGKTVVPILQQLAVKATNFN